MPEDKNILDLMRGYIHRLTDEAIPQLSVNCVIICFHEKSLKVVVNRMRTGDKVLHLLPGGYVKQKEDLSEAVENLVLQSTGLENILFRQFAVFGKPTRSFAHELTGELDLQSVRDKALLSWMSMRFVSLGYLALVDYQRIDLKPTEYFESAQWLPMDQSGKLAMDHEEMVRTAREYLVKELLHSPIAPNLLPSRFTLPDLQALMEAILDRNIDRPNFRRKILSTGILVKVGVEKSGKGRPADIYRFKNGKNTTLVDEFRFGF